MPDEIAPVHENADATPTSATPTPPTQEERPVEIHKPHAAKTWKEFFIELGTIVAGILIAISLEQLVEYVHWEGEVIAARQAILAEMAANNFNLFAYRVAVAPCVDKQLGEDDAILTALEAGRKPGPASAALDAPSSLIRDSEWQSERASQVLTHFPRAELAVMSRYYALIPDIHNWMVSEGPVWQELSVLRQPPAGITASDLIRLRVNLGVVRYLEDMIVLNARRELAVTQQFGVTGMTADPVRVRNYCTMNAADYVRYRNSQDLR